jgi:hypothetical protein
MKKREHILWKDTFNTFNILVPIPKQDLDFQRYRIFFVISNFIDIEGIVDHHCLSYLFKIILTWKHTITFTPCKLE